MLKRGHFFYFQPKEKQKRKEWNKMDRYKKRENRYGEVTEGIAVGKG